MISPEYAIQIDRVGLNFDERHPIIKDLSINFTKGEFVSLLGPSGSGKTTLLRLVAGLLQPSVGKIEISGARLLSRGFVFQDPSLLPWKNVAENIELPLRILDTTPQERLRAVTSALELVGLSNCATAMPHELSGGMKMRVSLARALVSEPSLLLLDEPFSALDEFTRNRLGEELRRIWLEKKMTVLFVTHSVSEATFISDRALVFSAQPMKLQYDISISLGLYRESQLRVETRFHEELRKVYEAFNKIPH